jgi:protein-disulfide isomerase
MRLTVAALFPARPQRVGLALGLVPAVLLMIVPAARAQFGAPPTTQVRDASALKPPAGAKAAIIEFYDLECPTCAETNPQLMAAVRQYRIPWVHHDFIIPTHNWSRQAAINARFFDTRGPEVGNDYRNYIFANQSSIETPADLNTWTQRFAAAHRIAMPFTVDPAGRFAAEVQADTNLGLRMGVDHTPTIWVVTNAPHVAPFVEVVNRYLLNQIIEQALAETKRQ